ncbi:hypothetical protein [Fusobacterium mortiferum]|uniref:Uncharacterized protein n=1 Tax=Fusobacterium mortiferum ATCC 9817 TaxID=469616 RepID=A0ABN5JFJ4_FUSMR|nr:hypothetical protein [Fusobacterium mortiferum]AVQ19353.1 hypothetical protein C4N19_09730 [Fusobacterium mortiferum ATCC 9817]EEO36236.1 hypothetical protein FMAG_01798 [Fusobacterium mortiferum ATCC 9817]
MSKQAKKREINKYRVEIARLYFIIAEQQFLNESWIDKNNELRILIRQHREREQRLQRENEQLKAENYSLKHRGFFKRLLGA